MTDAIAKRIEIFVRCVLAKFDLMLAHINVDFFAPDAEERPHNGKIDIVDAAGCNLAHSAQACRPCAAKEIDQKGFDQVIGMMREENRFASSVSCSFSEKFVPGVARSGFNRHLLFCGESANVRRLEFEFGAKRASGRDERPRN